MKWKDEDGFLAQIKNEERFGIFCTATVLHIQIQPLVDKLRQ
jgi:hypothetical protein